MIREILTKQPAPSDTKREAHETWWSVFQSCKSLEQTQDLSGLFESISPNPLWKPKHTVKSHVHVYIIVLFSLCRPQNKTWKMIDGLSINDFSRAKMDATAAELVEERDTALDFLGQWLSSPAGQQQHQHPDHLKPGCSRLWRRNPPHLLTVPAAVCVCVRVCDVCVCVSVCHEATSSGFQKACLKPQPGLHPQDTERMSHW